MHRRALDALVRNSVVAILGGQRYRGDSPLVTVPFDIVKRIRRECAEVISPLQFTVFSNFYGVIKTLCPFGLLQILCGQINLHALKRPHAEHIGRRKNNDVTIFLIVPLAKKA
jgi:hypothetical protein